MPHVTVPEVKQWLDATKFSIDFIEVALEETAAEIVLSKLAKQFPDDVLTWVDEASTPHLVRTVISIKYAAALYRRQYAEVTERMPSYPANMDRMAESLLEGILAGDLDLMDVNAIPTSQQPSFYPNDTSGRISPTGSPTAPGDDYLSVWAAEGDGQKFQMGKVF